jgi:hypothetical protein
MYISNLRQFMGKTSLVEMQMSSSDTIEIGEEALPIMRQLLAVHYVEGGVPLPIIALVEQALKSVGAWFHDPQYAYDAEEGYL